MLERFLEGNHVKIVLTHPYCWPYVRRGSERFLAELAREFTQHGHEVTTISSRPGGYSYERTEYGPRILVGQKWHPIMAKLRIQGTHTFAPGCLYQLLRLKPDIVFCLHYIDAWAANVARSWRGFKTIYYVTGPPVPHYLPRIPPDRMMMRSAIQKSDRVVTLGRFCDSLVQQHYGVTPEILPVPVDLEKFKAKPKPLNDPPTLLGIGSFDERRKGIRVLIDSFCKLKDEIPEAHLILSGKFPETLKHELLDPLDSSIRESIEVLGLGSVDDLPAIYQRATITVIPSMWEAYGMTALESLASGTPVVGTDHAGLGELLNNPSASVKFDPETDGFETMNVGGLTAAIRKGLELAREPRSTENCRQEAEKYGWRTLGPRYESLLKEVAGG
jgi:glycosyltransferase involved in cell wall biosynthesis